METAPERGHLRRLHHVWIRDPVYFVTVCTLNRQPALVPDWAPAVVASLRDAAAAEEWCIGQYLLMPDHIHFFCCPGGSSKSFSDFVGRFKSLSTRYRWDQGWGGKLWQREAFDHVLRSEESYVQKSEYVRHNPVRAGLAANPDDWPYHGAFTIFDVRPEPV